MKEALIDFSKFDENKDFATLDEIRQVNPHRFEMQMLDGVLFLTDEYAVGYKNVSHDEFWVRGHFPERPIMPGVLICECAAQLSSYFAIKAKLVETGYVGLGAIEMARFRGPVVPGDKLIVMLKRGRARKNQMFAAAFQGFVDKRLVVDGIVKGVALGE